MSAVLSPAASAVPHAGMVPISAPVIPVADPRQRHWSAITGGELDARVVRWQGMSVGLLVLDMECGAARMSAEMTPEQMRAVAAALVSAAHDIETQP